MSKELELIAHALADAADDGCFDNPPTFDDDGLPDLDVDLDEWHSGGEDRVHWMKLARASVSKLSDAGYSIVPSEGIVRTYQAASTLGHRYMSPKGFGCDREEAERWFALQQTALEGLPGVDTVRLEYRDEYVTGWLPLAAAAAAEEDQ